MRRRVQYEKDIGNTFDLVIESHWRIDPNGQLTKQEYYAFGGGRYTVGTLPTDYAFTGQKSDASDGLLFYNARYYDATIGRFISADVLSNGEPQSLNRYAYTNNNPLKYRDPSGNLPEESSCPSGDNWCWENRWYTAHGYCWSEKVQDWKRAWKPEIRDQA